MAKRSLVTYLGKNSPNNPDHTVDIGTLAVWRKRRKQLQKLLVLFALGCGAFALIVFSFSLYSNMKHRETNAPVSSAEKDSTLRALGELIALPSGEDPRIARVVDPSTLPAIPFYRNAKVGDEVVIYPLSNRAFLFDPKEKKILEVSALSGELSASFASTPLK